MEVNASKKEEDASSDGVEDRSPGGRGYPGDSVRLVKVVGMV